MALSSDEDEDEDMDGEPPVATAPKGKRVHGESKRAKKHAMGGKKAKGYTPPLPMDWMKTETGWQKYKLPAKSNRVYSRHLILYYINEPGPGWFS
jgi:hypothetical protein